MWFAATKHANPIGPIEDLSVTQSLHPENVIHNFFLNVTATDLQESQDNGIIAAHFKLDIVGRTALSGHYDSLATLVNVLQPVAYARLASASYKIVQTLVTTDTIAAQIELKATTRDGATYNPRGSLSTLVLKLKQGRVIHARFWPDTEQVERIVFGNDFV